MYDMTARAAPPRPRGLNLLAILAGGVAAVPLFLLVAFTMYLVR